MTLIDILPAPPLQILGLIGAATYILNYLLLALRLRSSDSLGYFLRNLLAALLVLASLGHAFNAAVLVIQVFFVLVSLLGIASRLGGQARARLTNRRAVRLRPLA